MIQFPAVPYTPKRINGSSDDDKITVWYFADAKRINALGQVVAKINELAKSANAMMVAAATEGAEPMDGAKIEEIRAELTRLSIVEGMRPVSHVTQGGERYEPPADADEAIAWWEQFPAAFVMEVRQNMLAQMIDDDFLGKS